MKRASSAKLSSTYYDSTGAYPAANCINDYFADYCASNTAALAATNPWLMLDFGDSGARRGYL